MYSRVSLYSFIHFSGALSIHFLSLPRHVSVLLYNYKNETLRRAIADHHSGSQVDTTKNNNNNSIQNKTQLSIYDGKMGVFFFGGRRDLAQVNVKIIACLSNLSCPIIIMMVIFHCFMLSVSVKSSVHNREHINKRKKDRPFSPFFKRESIENVSSKKKR